MMGEVEKAPINKLSSLNHWRQEARKLRKEAQKLRPHTLREELAKLKIGQ